MSTLIALDMADDPEEVRSELQKIRDAIVKAHSSPVPRWPLLVELANELRGKLDRREVKADDPIVVKT